MAEKTNNTLSPQAIQTMSELTNVRRISDLDVMTIFDNDGDEIKTSNEFNNSYLLSSTYIDNRYYNYRVKLNEITKYIHDLGTADLSVFRHTFDFFIQSLRENTNTENSYVKFVPVNPTIDIMDPDNNYSYTFEYLLSSIQKDDKVPFSYKDGQQSSYAYTNVLTNGLVTSYVMEEYVRDTMARILGVPNTPAAVEGAIDSVIEFVDWFKGYGTNEDRLANLVNSFRSADAVITSKIDNMNFTFTAPSNEYLTSINQEHGKITAVQTGTISVPINGVSTDSNSFTAGGTKYTLVVENKKLKFVEYVLMSITSKTPNTTRTLEIDSTATKAERTFKVVANKTITSATWSGAGSVTTSGTSTTLIATQNNNNTITRSVEISDGTTNVSSGDMTIQFTNKRYFLGYSSDPNLTFTASNNGTNILSTSNYHNLKDSLSTSDIFGKGFTGNGYWYMIWPTTVSIGNIYFGAGTAKAAAAGGWHEHVQNWQEGDPVTNSNHITVNQYSTGVTYHVYRSDHPFSVQMNIQF